MLRLIDMTRALTLALTLALASLVGAAAQASEGERAAIDAGADAALEKVLSEDRRAERLSLDAIAILIFPEITKAGLGIGAEGGKGVLRVNGESTAYYRTNSISFGAQAGFQTYGYALFFFSQEALDKFTSSKGYEIGADASVAILEAGVTAEVDTTDLRTDTVGIVFDESGFMASAAIEGSKISELDI